MDWSAFHSINSFAAHTRWAHGFMADYAKYGIVLLALLLILGLVVSWPNPKRLGRTVAAGVAPLVALALNQPIANAVDRARPYAAHQGVHVLIARSADPSFMSDHSVVAGAVCAGLLFVSRRLGLVALALALLLAFARVYVGAHYPGDVLAGLIFGGAIACGCVWLADRLLAPLIARLFDTSAGKRLVGTAR